LLSRSFLTWTPKQLHYLICAGSMNTGRSRRHKYPSWKITENNTGTASESDDSPERPKRKRGPKDASGNPSESKDKRREAAGIQFDLSQPAHLNFSDQDGGLSLLDLQFGVGDWLSQDVLSQPDSSIPPRPPSLSSIDLDDHLRFDLNSDASAASEHTVRFDPDSDASRSEHTLPFDVDSDVSVLSMTSSLDGLLFAAAPGADGQVTGAAAGEQKSASVEHKSDGVVPGPVVVEENAASTSVVDLLRTHPSGGSLAHNQRLMPQRRATAANPTRLMAQHHQNTLAAGSQQLDGGKESRPLPMSRDTTAPLTTALDLPAIIHSVIGVMFERSRSDVDAQRKSNRVPKVGKAKSLKKRRLRKRNLLKKRRLRNRGRQSRDWVRPVTRPA
jgi:hypothetical protein